VKPPRIRECRAHIKCRALWTKIIGSSCLVLGNAEPTSTWKEIEKLGVKERAMALNRLIFFSYQKSENVRNRMFAEAWRIHTLTEKDGEVETKAKHFKPIILKRAFTNRNFHL